MARSYVGARERLVHDLTNRLALGNTTVGFGLGGLLAVLLIALSHFTPAPVQTTFSFMILSLALSGTTAGLCSGRTTAASLSLGAGFLVPGAVVALLLSPQVMDRLSGLIGPWELLLWAAGFASSFVLAGTLAALPYRQGGYWVRKTCLGLGIGGAGGGTVLAIVLLAIQRVDELSSTSLPPYYVGSICLAVFIACTVGGSRLDAERRVSVRVPAAVSCLFTVVNPRDGLSATQVPSEGFCNDLSLGGMIIETGSRLADGDILSMQLRLFSPRSTRALVRVVREEPAGKGTRTYGLEFVRLEVEGQSQLTQFYISRERRFHSRKQFVVVAVVLILALLSGVSLEAYHQVDRGRQRAASSSHPFLP